LIKLKKKLKKVKNKLAAILKKGAYSMENELLKVDVEGIQIVQGLVQFNDYDRIKKEAEALAEQIKTVEVNEENVKASKKLLAIVNKRLKELEDTRIGIKKTMLEPYQTFEEQVKTIITIVKEADAEVREQVKLLEEFDRIEKEDAIKAIWEKRIVHYSYGSLIPFEDFASPKHFNKTTSIDAVEKEMITFLEHIQKDMNVIKTMDNSKQIVSAYLGCYDLAEAIAIVTEQLARDKEIEKKAKALEKASAKEEEKQTFRFEIYDQKDFKLVEMFMKQNKINYEVL
jgi:hypothetical protein